MTRPIVIVGGGVAGLAAAHRVRALDPDAPLVVLEASERPGGVLRSVRTSDGFLCEHSANGFLGAPTSDDAVGLAKALGLRLVPANPQSRRRWIYRRGALREVPTSPLALLRTDLLSLRGRLRLALEPWRPRGTAADETVAEFGRRRLGPEATEALLAPMTLGIHAGDAEELSLPAALPRLAALERAHGSLLRGVIASRRRGDTMPGLWAPPEGVEALPAALARTLGGSLHLRTRVVALVRDAGRIHVELEEGERLEARTVALAMPPRAAAELLAPHDGTLAARLRAVPVAGAVVVHVALPRDAVTRPLDGFGFLVARGERLRCLGCVFESTVWPDRAPPGWALLRLIYGGTRDPGVLALDDAVLERVVTEDLRVALSVTGAPRVLSIVRWTEGIPQYRVGHLAWRDEVERGAARLGIVLAGNGYRGVAVSDCIRDAERVASTLLEAQVAG